jgi:hypothetical protein
MLHKIKECYDLENLRLFCITQLEQTQRVGKGKSRHLQNIILNALTAHGAPLTLTTNL